MGWLCRVLAFALSIAACGDRTGGAPVISQDLSGSTIPFPPRDGRVVLVTIDGARWQDAFVEANMPHTHALVATRGVAIGADLPGCATVHTASNANMSLPGYLAIFTGHASTCLDNACERATDTVFDEAARANRGLIASISSWAPLAIAASNGQSGVFVASGRDWPESAPREGHMGELVAEGERAWPFPGSGTYRPDAHTAAIAVEYLRAHEPAFLHVGLGDPDEYGHRGDYPGYLAALRAADDVIGAIAGALDAMGTLGEKTTVIVTPDHGRSASFRDHGLFYPESARTFLFAFGGGVPVGGIACADDDLTLADIAPTIRVLAGLPADTADGAGTAIELITGPR